MIETKFRAWDEGHRTMIYFDMWGRSIDPKPDMNIEVYERRWRTTKNVEVMQYTGRKDKNGKEIYRGDIIRNDLASEDKFFFQCEVVWSVGETAFMMPHTYDDESKVTLGDALEQSRWEVIGNICENPELPHVV